MGTGTAESVGAGSGSVSGSSSRTASVTGGSSAPQPTQKRASPLSTRAQPGQVRFSFTPPRLVLRREALWVAGHGQYERMTDTYHEPLA